MIQRTGPESLTNMGECGSDVIQVCVADLAVSTFVAGCDVTAKNGGTRVIPGMIYTDDEVYAL